MNIVKQHTSHVVNPQKDVVKQVRGNTFSFSNHENTDLIKLLQKNTRLKYKKSDPDAKQITITHTGEIKQLPDSELYYYQGGKVKVVIDERECCIVDELTLSATLRAGNPEDHVKESIAQEIEAHILTHSRLLSEKIKPCLN